MKIFWVDDDFFSLTLYKQCVKNLGFNDITTFSRSEDFLTQLSDKPELIFLDQNMEPICGVELLKEIKRFDPSIYVVIVSAQENLNIETNVFQHGAFDFVVKGEGEQEKIKKIIYKIIEINKAINDNF